MSTNTQKPKLKDSAQRESVKNTQQAVYDIDDIKITIVPVRTVNIFSGQPEPLLSDQSACTQLESTREERV